MPKASALSDNAPVVYRNLVDTIRQEITKTQDKVQKQKAICYWKIGRHIAKHLLNDQGKSGYNKRLLQTVSFYRSFSIPNPGSELSWTNYRDLLKIPDQTSRDALFDKVKAKRVTI
jgi:hypothetical protein